MKNRKDYLKPSIEAVVCPDICSDPLRESYDFGDGNGSTIGGNPNPSDGPNYGNEEKTKQTTLWDFNAWDDIE